MSRFGSLLATAVFSITLPAGLAAADPSRAETEFFEKKIRPVLIEHCAKCHSAEKKQAKGGFRLDSRAEILKGGRSGPGAVSGDPAASLLMRAVRGTDKELKMPPEGEPPLNADQIRDLAAWIQMGLPFPGTATSGPTATTMADLAKARQFWSLQPPKETAPPTVRAGDWPKEPLDRFVLARLEEKGLTPSPPADKRTLLRRATYDLTGLPPTPEAMEAFLADQSESAFEKAIDRLLASLAYGERWGRHWLDVARYADTKWVGAGEERRIPFAYAYRDWVIRALNEDMPYDRFIRLQLAADQIPNARPTDQAALGFLTVGRWFTGNIHDVIDDQIDVVTRGLLGLTVQCARCHDHKFDPVSAKDYYSLYGLFAAARMPAEGAGILAELPETEPPPVDAATEAEIARLRERLDKQLADRQERVRAEYRTLEKTAAYLMAATPLVGKSDNDIRAAAKAQGLTEPILFGWARMLQRFNKTPHSVYGPWFAFASIPPAEFAEKTAAVTEKEKAAKMLNRHVAAILMSPPKSLDDLANRYAKLFSKFDSPETSTDADQETVRQLIRGNDAPAQISMGELGQFLSKDELAEMVRMRREILAKITPLSERADQYLSFRHEAAPAIAEVRKFIETRQAAVAAEIRSPKKIAEYLLAAREVQGADEFAFKTIVNGKKLNDRLLRRWVTYLRQCEDRDDPVFAIWRAFASPDDATFSTKAAEITSAIRKMPRNNIVAAAFAATPTTLKDVAERYGELIAKHAGSTVIADPAAEAIRQVSVARESPLGFKPDEVMDYFTRKDTDELRNKEVQLARVYFDSPGSPPRAPVLRESPRGYAQKVFVRGNPSLPGDDAPSRFLAVLDKENGPRFDSGKGREQLATAITDSANPLTARVIVNRVWQWHFGVGLVRTPSDFGTRGETPSQPELLDYLARRFVAEGWSLKKLHRHILLSATYQQASLDRPAARAVDPENRLLWRATPRRLGFEEVRDSLLTAAGRLDPLGGGLADDLTRPNAYRRTVYGMVDRLSLPGFFRNFDFPSADAHVPGRFETAGPQQALFLMNDRFVLDRAADLARRTESAKTPEERITTIYRLTYGRAPSAEELSLGLAFVGTAKPVAEQPLTDAWQCGTGEFSETEKRMISFQPFTFFSNGQWKGGPQENDPAVGRASLHGRGGNAGRNGRIAVVRRWVAPRDGTVSITGVLSSQSNSLQPIGDGVRGRIVSGRHGLLGAWLVHGTEETTDATNVVVKTGDVIDFVVDARGREQHGGFEWSPVIKVAGDAKAVWDSGKDFRPPTATAVPPVFGPWERFSQILLEANEFVFLD
ncbi:PSD1 and planctomycete cytochrome C domain-containing protein [Zavarzinella formosa]|uniref:PSD1 and planctomycete cytochrome C domain-containing protein n=1 Tax=Zavarzinella formosa TaxID=360055 RepID=UPI0002DFFC1A|nr:PSD1 and planctomycete cytochrome C domain-containing protein [Zavarzinella formosa]